MRRFGLPVLLLLFLGCFSFSSYALASSSDGTIDSVNRWAWSENAGWIDFNAASSSVHVTDTALSGYAYGENVGWISLNCSNDSSCSNVNYKVSNDTAGNLSGYAWSENAGWIDFSPWGGGVKISASGFFSGYAYGENIGWINFSVDNVAVATDWRRASLQSGSASGGGESGMQGSYIPQSGSFPVTSSPSPAVQPGIVPPSYPPPSVSSSASSSTKPSMLPVPPPPSGVAPPAATYSFSSKLLKLYERGEDVRTLQYFLNAHGFPIASSGPGSPSKETDFFGRGTYLALKRFQSKAGLPATGQLGSLTKAYIARVSALK